MTIPDNNTVARISNSEEEETIDNTGNEEEETIDNTGNEEEETIDNTGNELAAKLAIRTENIAKRPSNTTLKYEPIKKRIRVNKF
jgi:hypothetical protein